MNQRRKKAVNLGSLDPMVQKEDTDIDEKLSECKIRIYGNRLGTTKDIISFWEAIEKNYISILAYEKLINIFGNQESIAPVVQTNLNLRIRAYRNDEKKAFMEHFEKYSISDIVSSDDYPVITKISFNSPGLWEVIGQWNIFKQIREYLNERHSRARDKEFGWDMEKRLMITEVESKQLSNDLLKLSITQEMIKQLRDLGLSDVEIRHVVQKSYEHLYLLNKHIDEGRIVDIRIVNEE